jgi:hypothetical protein
MKIDIKKNNITYFASCQDVVRVNILLSLQNDPLLCVIINVLNTNTNNKLYNPK